MCFGEMCRHHPSDQRAVCYATLQLDCCTVTAPLHRDSAPALCLLPLLVAAGPAGCVDAELGKWAHQLRHMQETGPCLSQPACQPNLPPQLRGSLYIRRSYRKLYELLWRESRCGKPGQQRGFVVTGTPGIGKSAFALYMIQQLGREGQIVFYQHQDDNEQTVWLKLDFRDPKEVVAKRTLPLPDGEHTHLLTMAAYGSDNIMWCLLCAVSPCCNNPCH